MPFLSILRLVVFILALVFSVIALGLGADLMSLTETYFDVTYIFCVLTVVSAALTIITLPIMLILDSVRQGAFTSTVVFELSWLSVLWILWLATAADTTYVNNLTFVSGCGYINPKVNQACQEFQGVEAFSYLTWLILMGYTIVLLVFAIVGQTRGNKVWLASVRDNTFLRRNGATSAPVLDEKYPPTTAPQTPYQVPAPGGVPMQTFHAQHPTSYQGTPSPLPAGMGTPHPGQNAYGQV